MGTSASNGGPTDPQWGKHKRRVTHGCKNGGARSDTAREALRDYIRTNNGSRNISRGGGDVGGSRSVQRTGRNIARFAARVQDAGLDEALREVGLGNLIGQPAETIIFGLVDRLCDDGGTFDEVDARKALEDLYEEMLEEAETYEDVEEVLQERMHADALEDLLSRFFGHYLFHQFCRIHYERLVGNAGEQVVNSYMSDVQDFIQAVLEDKMYNRDLSDINWNGDEGERITEEIHQQTLAVFEE